MRKFLVSLLIFLSILFLNLHLVRLIFFVYNRSLFPPIPSAAILPFFFYGTLFDLSTVCIFFPLISIFWFFPIRWLKKKILDVASSLFFIIFFIIITGPSIIDIAYYSFNNKRLTFEIFDFVSTIQSEFKQLLPTFLLDYWWLVLFFIIIFLPAYFIFKKLKLSFKELKLRYSHQLFFLLLFHALLVVGARGSIGLKPLSILSASAFVGSEYNQLVLNSTFSIIKTIGKKALLPVHFYDEAYVEEIYPYCKQYTFLPIKTNHTLKNVVIIAVESLSSAYMGFMRRDGITYTPFLDSLCEVSLVFPYAFANCKRSIEGIPAILSSYPALTPTPLLTSAYASNNLPGLPRVLRPHNYHSAFFHGGKKGTMMFDKYALSIGFDEYYSMDDYQGNKNDYDGHWGIYDEPFLKFTIKKINSFSEPFFAFIFTLSSHHPYQLPSDKQFFYHANDELPILPTIRYADYSLKQFFTQASQQTWFRNTIFIITADHSAQMPSGCFQHFPFNQAIPIIFYDPSNDSLKGVSPQITQQIDIFPSIVDYLNLTDTICCFGNSFFNNLVPRFAIMYIFPDIVGVFKDKYYLLHPDGIVDVYTYNKCFLFPHHSDSLSQEKSIALLKAFYQQYVNRTLKNSLWKK